MATLLVQSGARRGTQGGVGRILQSGVGATYVLPTTGLQLWLDADDASTFTYSSGTVVQAWNDKSGNGRHFSQFNGTNQPNRNGSTNGKTTVVFDGGGDHLSGSSGWAMTKPVTFFLVARNTGTGATRRAFTMQPDGTIFKSNDASGTLISVWQSAGINGPAWGSSFRQVTAVFNGASSKLGIDGGADLTGDTGSMAFSSGGNPAIGAFTTGVESWQGDIAELIIYQREVSGTERTDIETYLRTKWGTPAPPPIPTTGLTLWLDAADASMFTYSTGTSVTQWSDKSGNGRHFAQGTGSLEPNRNTTINGVTAVAFAGDALTIAGFASSYTAAELFIVVKNTTENGGGMLGRWGTSTDAEHYPFTDNIVYEPWGTTVRKTLGNPTPALTDGHAYNVRTAAGSYVATINGGALYSTATNTVGFSAGTYYIGRGDLAGTYAITGAIGEVIVYDRVLSSAERAEVQTYLEREVGDALMPVGTYASAVHIAAGGPAGIAEFVAIGAKTTADATPNSIDVAHPAGTAADQILVAGRCTWRSTSECDPSDETGWTAGGELAGGTGTAADNHTTIIRADYRELSGALAGPTAFDQSGTPSSTGGAIGVIASYKKYSGSWSVATATGDDAAHAADRSVTASSTIAFEPGDTLVAFAAVDTDTSLASFSAPALTASGITFGTTTRRTSGAGITTGNDGNIEMFDATVTAGTATVAPVLTFTTSTSQCGPVSFVRLRGGPAVAPGAPTLTGATPGDTTIALTWTAGTTGGSAITDYIVEESADGSTGWAPITDSGGVLTSHTVTGLTNGVIKYYRVAATNSVGTGSYSNVLSATPTSTPPITFVQAVTNQVGSGNYTIVLPGVVSGNYVIVGQANYQTPASAPTDTLGHTWSQVAAVSTNNLVRTQMWYTKVTTGGTMTITVGGTDGGSGTAVEFSGLAASSALDAGTSGNNSGSAVATAINAGATGTLPQANCLIVAVMSFTEGATYTINVGSGFTQAGEQENNSSYQAHNMEYKIVSATTSVTPDWTKTTGSATDPYSTQRGVFKGA